MNTYVNERFLYLAKAGRNQWRYYLSAIPSILATWYCGTVALGIIMITWVKVDNNPATNFNPKVALQFEGISPLVLDLYVNSGFLFLFLGLYVAVRFIHRRQFITLITTKKRISWSRISQAFIISFSVQILAISFAYLSSANSFQLNFQPDSFLILLLISLITTPIQTSVEELFYRGYLMQAIGLITRKVAFPVLFSSILFTIFHLRNPEVLSQKVTISLISVVLNYFITGLFLAWITIKDNSLELAFGFHAASNLGVSLFISANNTLVPSPAIFSIGEIKSDISDIFVLLIKYALFYWLVFKVFPKLKPLI